MQLTFEKDEVILKFPRDLLSDGYVQDFFQRLKSEISPETGIPEDSAADVADMGKSGVKDGSVHHDRYIYGSE